MANLLIIFHSFYLHHLKSLQIFWIKINHSRQFTLFNAHGINTFNYINSFKKNSLPELVILLNNRKNISF